MKGQCAKMDFHKKLRNYKFLKKCYNLTKKLTSKAKIIFDEPVKWTLDGEYGGKHKEIDIELVPDAINFIVPPKDRKQIRLEEKKKVHLQKLIEKRKKVF